MENRFTFKDFVFAVLLIGLIGVVLLAIWQYNHNEKRLIGVGDEVNKLANVQRQQLMALQEIQKSLKSGVALNPASTMASDTQPGGIVRRTNPDGSIYVYYPKPPVSPHDPRNYPNYAPGDWLVQNVGGEPTVITPYIDREAGGSTVQGPVLERMITQNPETLEWEPFLAESYEILPDKLTYRFTLRKDIRFSDGTPITADDVIFSYNTVMNPGVDSDHLKSYLKRIKSVRKVDDRTVEFVFHEPYFKALEVAGAFFEIIPRHIYKFDKADDYNNRTRLLVGSGPYVFEEKNWENGQQITLVRNENYWGQRPTFDRIVYRFIPNPQAALQSFQDGQLDSISPLPEQYVRFENDPSFREYTKYAFPVPNSGYRFMAYNLKRPVFKDKLTRQALTMLLDREAIIQQIQMGLASPITGPFPPMVEQSAKDIQAWPYDPDAAQKKLAEAGWKRNARGVLERDGTEFKFNLMIPAQNANYEQHAAYVKEQFRKAGIDVAIQPFEWSVMVKRLDERDFDATMLNWTGSIEGDPTQIWHSASIANRGHNFISFNSPEADALIEQAVRELDEKKRMALWHKFHRLLHEEQPYTFLWAQKRLAFVQPRFENTKPYKTGLDPTDWFVPFDKQKHRQ